MKKIINKSSNINIIKRVMSVLCVCAMLFSVGGTTYAEERGDVALESYVLKALGRAQMDVDGSGKYGDNPEDFVYDSDDLYEIEGLIKNGKTLLSESINEYPLKNVKSLDTFSNFSSAIDTLTALPSGRYYYDITTGTDDILPLVRYVKENDKYYLCDQYGEKVSDTAQTVDENNLVEYVKLEQGNLSVGTAGMIDKTFVLGDGTDNLSFRNQAMKGNASQEHVLTGMTYTSSEGIGLLGTMPNQEAWVGIATEQGKITIPEGYHNGSGYIDTTEVYTNGYDDGYAKGYLEGQNNAGEIVYTYHTHGDGYCNQVPVYHQHTSTSGSCYTPIYCGASLRQADENNGNKWFCSNYDGQEANFHWFGTTKPTENGGRCPHIDGYSLVCGKTTSTVESYICTLDSDSIVSATIVFK